MASGGGGRPSALVPGSDGAELDEDLSQWLEFWPDAEPFRADALNQPPDPALRANLALGPPVGSRAGQQLPDIFLEPSAGALQPMAAPDGLAPALKAALQPGLPMHEFASLTSYVQASTEHTADTALLGISAAGGPAQSLAADLATQALAFQQAGLSYLPQAAALTQRPSFETGQGMSSLLAEAGIQPQFTTQAPKPEPGRRQLFCSICNP